MARYEIRLMFEWGGGCLWGMNETAKSKYGYAEIERFLPLSTKTKAKLAKLSEIHDEALDWSNPAGPSSWSPDDFERFELKAQSALRDVQTELGEQFFVWYDPLGGPEER